MTDWEPIEMRAMTYIKNDTSLDYDKKHRPAVFYNRMAMYMMGAIPKFNRPPEMLARLSVYTPPEFEALDYVQDEKPEEPVVIETDVREFDICSAGVVGKDPIGNPTYRPVSGLYDKENGTVTIPETELDKGDMVNLYLYKSGRFQTNLNDTEIDILAFAVYVMWEHRFDNDALERKSKIRDSSFTTISEASQTNANTSRMREADQQLYGMLRAYQDNLEYNRVVMGKRGFPSAEGTGV